MSQPMTPDSHTLTVKSGTLEFPAFLPDATSGMVRSLDASDLAACGVQGLVMNVFHLMQRPGSSTVQALGGLHSMAGWRRPIITDSGGFQAYSIIRQDPKRGSLGERGISFRPEGGGRKYLLSPEKCVQLQLAYGSDIVMCLDDCTHPGESEKAQRDAVERTVSWARRCKAEFERLAAQKDLERSARPLLFAVVQGGDLVPFPA